MTDSSLLRSSDLLDHRRSRLLVVDVQQKLVPVIHRGEDIVRRIGFLMSAAQHMKVPVVVSEQYPDGLGPTVANLAEHSAVETTFDKVRFSAAERFCEHVGISAHIAPDAHDGRDQVILVGIESHVCVLQTGLDLLARGFRVFVVDDASGSGTQHDHEIGIRRLQNSGADICTAESVAFEWCQTAEADNFKAISNLVRDLRTSC